MSSVSERLPSSSGGGNADKSATLMTQGARHLPFSSSCQETSSELGGRFDSHGTAMTFCLPPRDQPALSTRDALSLDQTSKTDGASPPISSSIRAPLSSRQ